MSPQKKFRLEFGARIRRLRVQARLTVTALAKAAGMSVTYLSKVERGELPPPGEKKIKRLANALRVSPAELLNIANRVPSDVLRIVQRHPAEYGALLRAIRSLNRQELRDLLESLYSLQLINEEEEP